MNRQTDDLLKAELERLTQMNAGYLGYPLARDFSFDALAPFLNLQINNVGDPFTPSSLTIDTKEREIEVLHFFSKMLRASIENTWGYVTNGGSEGNLYGLYLAREAYPNGMVYYSESTHYSVKKNLHLLNIPNIVIRSLDNGEIDYRDLDRTVKLRRHRPAIFFMNVGTTMTEAIDQLDKIKAIITKYALKDYYIHVDGALAGIMAPFYKEKPKFDFQDGIDSISISGHKFIGSPIPCGIVLCKKEHSDRIAKSISYVKTKDTTITGSRNGLSPLIIWYALKKLGVSGLRQRYESSKELAEYTLTQLTLIGYDAWKNKNAITIVLKKPSDLICKKYQLAVQDDIAHIICMPGIEKSQIDALIDDLKETVFEKPPLVEDFNAMMVEF
ncbi:MAG: histidine decarboxylase [Bacteroidetes bacterium]|nr:histidine decarboxylase [Bacteroidota bacterium]